MTHRVPTPIRKGVLAVTQLYTTVDNFAASLDKSGQLDVSFLDFSEGKVTHGELINILIRVNIKPRIIKWE